jgi:hypothetical protein
VNNPSESDTSHYYFALVGSSVIMKSIQFTGIGLLWLPLISAPDHLLGTRTRVYLSNVRNIYYWFEKDQRNLGQCDLFQK